jgi:hypothetical protein
MLNSEMHYPQSSHYSVRFGHQIFVPSEEGVDDTFRANDITDHLIPLDTREFDLVVFKAVDLGADKFPLAPRFLPGGACDFQGAAGSFW